jgi:stage V sporulation protein SpoVS
MEESGTGPSDLFRRAIDNILTPYAKAVAAEGYRFSTDRFAERFGLSDPERGSFKDVFSVSITKEEYGYDSESESGVAGRASVEKRRRDDRFRVEANSLLRESIAEIGTRGTGNGSGKYSSGGLTPLEGGPVRGEDTSPDIKLVRVAEQYAADNGIDLKRQSEYAQVDPALAYRVSSQVEGVSFAGQFWYETEVAFKNQYQEKIDAIVTRRPSKEVNSNAGAGVWSGQSVRQGVENAANWVRESRAQTEREGSVPSGGQPGVETQAGTRGTGNGSGKYSSGGLTPLEGGPVRGEDTSPDIKLVRVAEQYAADNGIDLKRQSEYAQVDPALAYRVSSQVEGVSFAGQFWYETEVAFKNQYQEKIDAITNRAAEKGDRATRGEGWSGESISDGVKNAASWARESEAEAGREGSVPSGGKSGTATRNLL